MRHSLRTTLGRVAVIVSSRTMSSSDETRASLIQRVRDPQDRASWQEFYELYRPFLFNIARRHGLSADDADEVVQDVFAKVAQAVGEFQVDAERGRFRGWLKTIAVRKLIDRKRALDRNIAAAPLAVEPAAADPLEQEWDEQYRRHVLQHAMQKVRERAEAKTWACFDEHTLKGRPAAEVAEQLGMKVNAVYQNAARTLQRIREQCLLYEEQLSDA
jgi:RNA polymerase sigma-70 factor (ECF subfamily)